MENNLDRYFREKLSNREHGVDPAWWQQAEALLDADRNRYRRFWTVILLTAIAALLVAGWWLLDGEKKEDNILGIHAQEIYAESQQETPTHIGDFENREMPQEKSGETSNALQSDHSTAYFDQNIKKQGQTDTRRQTQKNIAQPSHIQPPPAQLPISENNTQYNSNFTAENIFPNPSFDDNNIDESITSGLLEMSEITPAIDRTGRDLMLLDILPLTVRGDFLKNIGTRMESPNIRSNRWRLGFVAAQIMRAGNADGGQAMIGHRAGGVAHYCFTKNLFVGTGLQYHRRTGTFEVSKAAAQRSYRFGLEVDTTLLKPSSLHYVSVPLHLGWQHGRHALEAGLLLDYLASIRGAIGAFEKTDDLPPRKEFRAKEEGWLAEDGYKKWTATAQTGYRYRVNGALSFGVYANYTFGGILDENHAPPTGRFLLKEADKFYLTVQAVYFIK